jgi:hypothetical protein
MASKVNSKFKNILLWIPDGIDPNDITLQIANTILADKKLKTTNVDKTEYNNDFREFYNTHIAPGDTVKSTFCSAEGAAGVNIQYLIANAKKPKFVTLIAVKSDHFNDSIDINAVLVFRWAKSANALKIQVLCADQRKKGTGDGTKLLNVIKKTLTSLDLNDIYLNPIDPAVPYYIKQNFRNTTNSDKIIHDSSDPKPKTPTPKPKSKTKTPRTPNSKSKTKTPKSPNSKTKSPNSKPKPIPVPVTPSMTMNLRARRNWNKTKTKFKAMTVIKENINKSPSKRASPYKQTSRSRSNSSQYSRKTSRNKKLLLKADEVVTNLTEDQREMVNGDDIIKLLENADIRNITEDDEDIIRNYVYKKYDIEKY